MKSIQPTLGDRFSAEEVAAFRSGGFWGDECLSDFVDRNATEQPDALFNVDGRATLSFGELKLRSEALAGNLHRLGVEMGDRVSVQLPNWIEASIAYCAVARLGAVYVPRMMVYREAEMQDAVDRTQSKVLIVADRFRGFDHLGMALGLRERCPSLREVVVVGDAQKGTIPFQELVEGPAYEGERPQADDLHVILFTSGTTARPKGVVHTFNTYVACAHILVEQYRVTRDDVCFMPSPIMHNTGNQTGLLLPLFVGCPTVYQDVFEPAAALGLISEHGCTYSVGATPFVTAMMDAFDPARHDLSRFRLFACGGAPVPGVVVERAVRILGCRLMTVFGQGESHVQTATDFDDPVEVVASSDGRAVKGMQVTIRDDDGSEVPAGGEGEICSKGPGVMLGYWQDPQQTEAAIDEKGWFHSGDLGRMNEAGYLRVTGRKKDIIIRGGMNISALEVEELLLQHPSVKEVAVVGMPDPRLGEKVCAYVVPMPGARPTLEELTGFMKSKRVMMQKLPERLELRESLPYTPTGKVEKFRLRDEIRRLLSEGWTVSSGPRTGGPAALGADRGVAWRAVQSAPGRYRLEQLEVPEVGAEDGLLEVEVCGVCGSDVDLFEGRASWAAFPLAVGHEPVGRVSRIGATAARRWGVETGQRVAVLARLQCGRCRACAEGLDCTGVPVRPGERPAYGFRSADAEPRLWGGFATHLYLAPETRLVPMPDGVSTAAASLFNPLANGIEWTQEVGRVRPGERVAVLGPGPRGLACVVAALEAGARRVVAVGVEGSERRLEAARRLGARTVMAGRSDRAAAILDELGGAPDLVLDTTPLALDALELALEVVRERGRVVAAGFKSGGRPSLDVDRLIHRQVRLLGAYSKSVGATVRAVEVLAAGGEALAELIATDAYGLDRAEEAVRAAAGGLPGAAPIHVRVEARLGG